MNTTRLLPTLRPLLAGACLALTLSTAPAALVISNLPGTGTIGLFGEVFNATMGQTITAVAGNNFLDSFTFRLDDVLNPGVVDFAGYVMAWDGTKATGPVLYESATRSTTNNGGAGGFEVFEFSTGGLELTAGSQYVLFLSASKYFDGITGQALMQTTLNSAPNGYAGGGLVFLNNGNDFNAVTTTAWNLDVFATQDLAFTASFSSTGPVVAGPAVPEPTTALFGAALVGVVGLSRRRGARAMA